MSGAPGPGDADAQRDSTRGSIARRGGSSNLDHLEVRLLRGTVGATEGFRHVRPAGSGRNAVFGKPGRLVVDESAQDALPGLEAAFAVGRGSLDLVRRTA